MSSAAMLSFGVDNDTFFQVSADNRLTLWDTSSGQLKLALQEKNHLTVRYTAAALGDSAESAQAAQSSDAGAPTPSKKKKKQKQKKNQEQEAGPVAVAKLAAIGTASGTVSVWDLVQGTRILEGVRVPGTAASQEVSDLCFDARCEKLYVCSAQSKLVVEMDVAATVAAVAAGTAAVALRTFKAGKKGCGKLTVSQDGRFLLTAASDVCLWDLRSGSMLRRFAGHSSPVRFLCFAPGALAFFSAAEDRQISMWAVGDVLALQAKAVADTDTAPPLERKPVRTFAVASAPTWLDCSHKASSNGAFELAVCIEGGRASVWNVRPDSDAAPVVAVELLAGAGAAGVSCVGLPSNAKASTSGKAHDLLLLVVRPSALRPVFQRVAIDVDGDSTTKKVALDDISSGLVSKSVGHVQVETKEEDEDAEEEDGEKTKAKKKAKAKLHVTSAAGVAARPQGPSGMEEEEEEDDRTMAERVRELNSALAERLAADDDDDSEDDSEDDDEEHKEEEGEDADADAKSSKGKKRRREGDGAETDGAAKLKAHNKGKQATAGSLSTILEQALQSNDNQLLEVCLDNHDAKTIKGTVQRLRPRRVLQFLNAIVVRFGTKPARGPLLLQWIRAVLDLHAAYLVKQPSVGEALAGLYQVIDARVAVFQKFLRLSGRLDFVVSQVAMQTTSSVGKSEEGGAKNGGPAVVYDEEASVQLPVKKKKQKKKHEEAKRLKKLGKQQALDQPEDADMI